ncbi:uncharacterized protein [Henckelia pumila]|uniref:uncharacterized protein n=1 Tax=Henckelia pumila TaxID=405737 RepID=UPI003C6E4BA3
MHSGYTVSTHFQEVLKSVLILHPILPVKPVPVEEDCTNETWKWFKGCLGALDGTYISVHVSNSNKEKYRTRKGTKSLNILGVCDRDMKFIYALCGWEGSAADARVLRDAINRSDGLKVPRGNYYLCDNGYANVEGFLTPYRRIRYHRDVWSSGANGPQNYKEFYNLKHYVLAEVEDVDIGSTNIGDNDFIDKIGSSPAWDMWRENLAMSMYHDNAST